MLSQLMLSTESGVVVQAEQFSGQLNEVESTLTCGRVDTRRWGMGQLIGEGMRKKLQGLFR